MNYNGWKHEQEIWHFAPDDQVILKADISATSDLRAITQDEDRLKQNYGVNILP